MKLTRKKLLVAALTVALAGAGAAGGLSAYFTAQTDTIHNTFTVGNGVNISVQEPNWRPDPDEELVPGMTKDKNPSVAVATGSTDSYAFLKVTIPGIGSNAAFKTLASGNVDNHIGEINTGWTQVGTETTADGATTYIFGYTGNTTDGTAASTTGTVMTNLSAGNSTPALFDQVQMNTALGIDDLYDITTTNKYYEVTWADTQVDSTYTQDANSGRWYTVASTPIATVVYDGQGNTDGKTPTSGAVPANPENYQMTSEVTMTVKSTVGDTNNAMSIDITGYAIQSANLGLAEDTPDAVWAAAGFVS